MRAYCSRWEPDTKTVDRMIKMRMDGHTYREIAVGIGVTKDLVVNWFLRTTGKTKGIYKGYHSKDEVHRRCGVYFDCTSLAEDLKGDCDAGSNF